MPGAEPVSLVVAPKERQLGVGLSVQNAARDPLVGVTGVDLGMKPSSKVLRTANGQAPDPSRTLDEVRVYPELPEEHLGAAIEGLAVLVVHPDPGARDAPLGDEEAQEPRDVLVHPHPLTRWQVHQRDPVPHGEIAGRHGDVPIRARRHDRVVAGAKGMTRHVDDLRPLAVSPYGHRMTPHVPDHRAIVQHPAAQVSPRLVSPDLADVADVQ